MIRPLLILAVWLGLGAAPARAGGIVVVADGRVPQYKEALNAALDAVQGARVVDPNAADAADQLRRAEPAVIVAVGKSALALARNALPSTPTVFCMVLGPAATASRTVTGLRLEVSAAAQLEFLAQVHPRARRMGVIFDPRVSGSFVEDATRAAVGHGVTLVTRPVKEPREVLGAVTSLAPVIDALWLLPDSRLLDAEMFRYLLSFTLERRLALFGFLDTFTEAGALASVAPDYPEIGRRAARMAAEMADRPGAPAPPPTHSPGALSVNLKTARQLNLTPPASVLARARHVYR